MATRCTFQMPLTLGKRTQTELPDPATIEKIIRELHIPSRQDLFEQLGVDLELDETCIQHLAQAARNLSSIRQVEALLDELLEPFAFDVEEYSKYSRLTLTHSSQSPQVFVVDAARSSKNAFQKRVKEVAAAAWNSVTRGGSNDHTAADADNTQVPRTRSVPLRQDDMDAERNEFLLNSVRVDLRESEAAFQSAWPLVRRWAALRRWEESLRNAERDLRGR